MVSKLACNLKRIFFCIIILFAVIGILWTYVELKEKAFFSTGIIFATPKHPVISPSGEYQLQITEGHNGFYEYMTLNIAKTQSVGEYPIVYTSKDMYRSSIGKTVFLWDQSNRVWVYSSDIGTYYYTIKDENNWFRTAFDKTNSSIELPQEIEKLLNR